MEFSMKTPVPNQALKITTGPTSVKVTAGILQRSGRVLIAQRGPGGGRPHKWEFPGGKIELGETPQACIERELYEELGIYVRAGAILARHLHYDLCGHVDLIAIYADWIAGNLQLRVHSRYLWVAPTNLAEFDFLSADLPIIAHLLRAAENPVV
jgi:8-oxo-dGTP diphosphatase